MYGDPHRFMLGSMQQYPAQRTLKHSRPEECQIMVCVNSLTGAIAGAVLASVVIRLHKIIRTSKRAPRPEDVSGGGSPNPDNIYESAKKLSEYLSFHYGSRNETLPRTVGLHEGLDFASRTGRICSQWVRKLGITPEAALDADALLEGRPSSFRAISLVSWESISPKLLSTLRIP